MSDIMDCEIEKAHERDKARDDSFIHASSLLSKS